MSDPVASWAVADPEKTSWLEGKNARLDEAQRNPAVCNFRRTTVWGQKSSSQLGSLEKIP